MAFAILMCGLVVPTVPNLFCWLKCRVAYMASYHVMQGIIRDNLSHITHMPGLPIAKLLSSTPGYPWGCHYLLLLMGVLGHVQPAYQHQ